VTAAEVNSINRDLSVLITLIKFSSSLSLRLVLRRNVEHKRWEIERLKCTVCSVLVARFLVLQGWEYSAEVFFVEIYNEQIHDLLNYNSGLVHEVRMVPNNKTDVYVSNLRVSTFPYSKYFYAAQKSDPASVPIHFTLKFYCFRRLTLLVSH